jgi:hypothetical protein
MPRRPARCAGPDRDEAGQGLSADGAVARRHACLWKSWCRGLVGLHCRRKRPTGGRLPLRSTDLSTRTRTTYRAITAGALLGASSPAALVCAAPYEAPGDLTGDVPVSGLSLFGVDPRAEFGRAAASAGDINGDGFDDIIVGAPFGDPGCRDDAGQAFVVFGGPDVDANGNLLSLEFFDTIAGVRINGAFPGDLLGFELAGGRRPQRRRDRRHRPHGALCAGRWRGGSRRGRRPVWPPRSRHLAGHRGLVARRVGRIRAHRRRSRGPVLRRHLDRE